MRHLLATQLDRPCSHTTLALMCCAMLAAGRARGQQLVTNPDFADAGRGWLHQHVEFLADVESGVRFARLRGSSPGRETDLAKLQLRLTDPPTLHELDLVVRVRARRNNLELMVLCVALGEGGERVGHRRVIKILAGGGWRDRRIRYVLAAETQELVISVLQPAAIALDVARMTLSVGVKSSEVNVTPMGVPAAHMLRGPGVIRARASTAVKALEPDAAGVVTFPVPNAYAQQVPLAIQPRVDPPSALRSARLVPREDGRNLELQLRIQPPAGVTVQVGWEALVLVGAVGNRARAAGDPDVPPPSAQPWLRATACVQSDDEAIRQKAAEFARDASGTEAYVRAVIGFTSKNRGTGARFDSLDASRALVCGGSCTSRANLCAALLRAHGIPARTQAHLPTWSGPLFEHWLVEYWQPGAGWTWVEPTRGEYRPPPWSVVVLNVAGPKDEDQAFSDRLMRSGIMRGVALHAVHDIAAPLVRGAVQELNVARAEGPIAGDAAEMATLFSAARAAFARLLEAGRRGEFAPDRLAPIATAVADGTAAKLAGVLR